MLALRRVYLPIADLRLRRVTALEMEGDRVTVDLDAVGGTAPGLRLCARGVVAIRVHELIGTPLAAGIAATPPLPADLAALGCEAANSSDLIFVALDDQRGRNLIRRLQLLARTIDLERKDTPWPA